MMIILQSSQMIIHNRMLQVFFSHSVIPQLIRVSQLKVESGPFQIKIKEQTGTVASASENTLK